MRKFVILILPVVVTWLAGCAITNIPSGPAKEFDKASLSVKEKRYSEAVAAYRKIVADSPRSALAADALYEIALIHLFHDNLQKEYAQAIKTFEEFLKFYPDGKRAPEAQNWLYILRNFQEQKRSNDQLNRTIQEQKNSNEQLNRTIQEQKNSNEHLNRTIQEQKKNSERLNRTIQEQKKNNERLQMSIEQLKRLDIMQEEKRETR
jgi:outer membrane protein assembly factor BamD (BamD/ComL family)